MGKAAAFFDLDKTLLLVDSGTSWMKFLYRRGEATSLEMLRVLYWASLHRLAILDMHTLATRLVADIAGDSVDEMAEKCSVWHRAEIRNQIAPAGAEALQRHRERGDVTVLLTASTQFVADVVREDLGIDHSLCSRLEMADGVFTGRLDTFCYGPGKVREAERLAQEVGIDLATSTFYTDSYTDLPMLQRVGTPVVVNPDARLRRHAKRASWPICDWTVGRPFARR